MIGVVGKGFSHGESRNRDIPTHKYYTNLRTLLSLLHKSMRLVRERTEPLHHNYLRIQSVQLNVLRKI